MILPYNSRRRHRRSLATFNRRKSRILRPQRSQGNHMVRLCLGQVTKGLLRSSPVLKLGAPRCGSGPSWCLEGPPHPPLQLEDPSLKPKPFPPLPLPPGRPSLVWGEGPRVQGGRGERGGPSSDTWGQTHIWGYSIKMQ